VLDRRNTAIPVRVGICYGALPGLARALHTVYSSINVSTEMAVQEVEHKVTILSQGRFRTSA